MKNKQQGLSLLELLISVGLSMSMTLLLMQLHAQSSGAVDKQQFASRQLESAAALQHILSHSVRDALYSVRSAGESISPVFNSECAGIVIREQCIAPVTDWSAEVGVSSPVAGTAIGSSVLQVKQSCCAGIVADQFYLAHRAGHQSNPLSLYRRRLETDGGYTAAVELVEGVTEFSVSFIVENPFMGDLVLVEANQVSDWWRLKAVRIQYRLEDNVQLTTDTEGALFSFTIVSRQWQESSALDREAVYALH